MAKIKICGIQSVAHAVAVASLGADLIGLVFAPSPRRISRETARCISAALMSIPSRPALVGVFVNQDADEVNDIAEELGLKYVQLSGDEGIDYCRFIQRPFIKVVHVSSESKDSDILKEIKQYQAALGTTVRFLLDTGSSESFGGTGRPFNWHIAAGVGAKFPIMVAGGLHWGNIVDLLRWVRPWGVDVSSGVETGGIKDLAKVEKFIARVRNFEPSGGDSFETP